MINQSRDHVFISYSHRDRSWLEDLRLMLAPYLRNRIVDVWDDTRIKPSMEWRDEIQRALDKARVAILLVSKHFLASKFITEVELPSLLKAASIDGLTILWIPVGACLYWEVPEIEALQALHDPTRPLDSLTQAERNRALVTICEGIKEATENPRMARRHQSIRRRAKNPNFVPPHLLLIALLLRRPLQHLSYPKPLFPPASAVDGQIRRLIAICFSASLQSTSI